MLRQALKPESANVSVALDNLAETERLSGDFAAAERDYGEALRIAAKVNYQDGMAYSSGNLAELALDREQWPEAERLACESLALAEKIGRAELVGWDCASLPKLSSARAAPPRRCPSPVARLRSWRSCVIQIWTRRARGAGGVRGGGGFGARRREE